MATPQTGAGDPKRSLELLWREFEPQPSRPGPKPKLTLDRIVRAAVALADRDGIEALNMRGVAAELGVGTMTLYRYVPGKGELLDLVIDRLNEEDEHGDFGGMDWREALSQFAEGLWEMYARHPWILEINQKRPVLGPYSLRGYDLALSIFRDLDLPEADQNLVITAVYNAVTGTALAYLMRDSADGGGPVATEEEWWEAQGPFLEKAAASGRYPNLAAMVQEDAWNFTGQDALRFTVGALLDGIAPRMEAAKRPRST